MLNKFFKHECQHKNIPVNVDEIYCPDCGTLVKNQWYIVRCKCCNTKLTALIRYDKIIPNTKFCKNCGSSEYYIQEIEQPNFVDIHYAVFKKAAVQNNINPQTNEIWVEQMPLYEKCINKVP